MSTIIYPNGTQSPAAFRRELRENERQRLEAEFVAGHIGYVDDAVRHIYASSADVDRSAIDETLAHHLPPRQSTPRSLAAVHECGHFVADEVEGMQAGAAHISGSRSGRDGWSGEATNLSDLYLEPGLWRHEPEDFNRQARSVLAGPIAEELIGDGNAMLRVGELMSAHVYSDRAAELTPDSLGAVWNENVLKAVALVERYHRQISELAEFLQKRKEITRWLRSVRKVLDTIEPRAPIAIDHLSSKGNALAGRIIAVTPCVAGLIVTKEHAE